MSYTDTIEALNTASGPIPYGLTNDYMFRAVFQCSNEALRHLLSALLAVPYDDIISCDILNPIILGENIDDKTCILDIRLLLNNDRYINLEMQTGRFEIWPNRVLFYLSRLYCNIRCGDEYAQIKPALHIGILTKSPFSDVREFYSEYLMTNTKNGHIFSRNFSARMLCLDQMDAVPEEERNSELYYWARLFKAATWEEVCRLVEEDYNLGAAAAHLRRLTEEEKIQLQCEARERYEMDMNSVRGEGMRTGIRIGREEGIGALILDYCEEGYTKDRILAKLQKRFSLSLEEAERYFEKYAPVAEQ